MFRPSTAESTEIAGVMIASPENSAAPATPSRKMILRAPAERVLRQGHQRQGAALALVVGAHQEEHVFERDGHEQGPDQQRNDADHLGFDHAVGLHVVERRLQRVKRAGADVAEDDAHRPEQHGPETFLLMFGGGGGL